MPALPCNAMSARLYSQIFQTAPPGSEHETSSTRHGMVGRCCRHTTRMRSLDRERRMPRVKRPGSGCCGPFATGIETRVRRLLESAGSDAPRASWRTAAMPSRYRAWTTRLPAGDAGVKWLA